MAYAADMPPGTRVVGIGGEGIVLGAPSNGAMPKSSYVSVRWDDGRQMDERKNNLRPLTTRGGSTRSPSTGSSPTRSPRMSTRSQASRPRTAPPPQKSARDAASGYGGYPTGGAGAMPAPGSPGRQPSGTAVSRTMTPPATTRTTQRALPGGLAVGDRVMGARGIGLVVGPAGSSPLRTIAVAVRWDSGNVTEERVSTLKAAVDQPLRADAWGAHAGAVERAPSRSSLARQERDRQEREKQDALRDEQLSPYGRTVQVRRRSALGAPADGQANPLAFLQDHSAKKKQGQNDSPNRRAATPRRDSQLRFADREQTFICFDWDDTLFPTNYVLEQMRLNPELPLARQPSLVGRARDVVIRKMALCEDRAIEVLQLGCMLGHTVVVTLAANTWVTKSTTMFYPRVGKLLKAMNIEVVCAQNPVGIRKARAKARREEQFWGLLKGFAISDAIEKFYSQYEGQSWKNVISIGDSIFERYGLIAASTAYMQGRRLSVMGPAPPYAPFQDSAWQKVDSDDHIIRLRVKCCKLVDCPDADELAIELDTLTKWLKLMVNFDSCFDLSLEDIEDESQVALVESVLRGERPATHLPKAVSVRRAYG